MFYLVKNLYKSIKIICVLFQLYTRNRPKYCRKNGKKSADNFSKYFL
jgi:hypothetical protein